MCRGNDWSVKNDWRAWHTTARIDSNDPSVSHFHGARNALWGGRWNTNRDLTLQEAVTVRAALITEATLIWFEATAMNEVAKETPQTLKCRQPDALVLGHGAFSVGASRG